MSEEFEAFTKIPRLSRDIIITEKIDGTNAQVFINENGEVRAGSRSRWIEPGKQDNYGFAGWVRDNNDELLKLGPGRHFGEWWGKGINRGYGFPEKVFSLFNVHRWSRGNKPYCCSVVPVLYAGPFSENNIVRCLDFLRQDGSTASPGYTNPEGIVIYHTAGGYLFKKTLVNDESPKGAVNGGAEQDQAENL